MFFVFIDFHRKGPPLSWLPRLAAAQCRRRTAPTGKRALAPGNGWRSPPPRAPPRHATSGQFRTRELARSRNGGRQGVDDASTGGAATYAF